MGFFANILNWLRDRVSPKEYSPPYLEAENPENWEPFSEDSSSEVMLAEYYDKHLFERARTQWQFGDWESLARIERESLFHHPQRASLSLLAAAGHQQLGDMATARQFTRLAQDWGASQKLISQVLIGGVYNTLGKAAALAGQQERAWGHFEQSVGIANSGGDVRLLAEARVGMQVNGLNCKNFDSFQYGLSLDKKVGLKSMPDRPYPNLNTIPKFKVEKISQLDLGLAWAGNTINTVIFRHHGIMTLGEYQYTAFYVDEHTLRLVRRHLQDDSLQVHDLAGEYNLKDAHNSISLGMDREGHLHISYDHHATQLKYRRSRHPHEVREWTDELSMTGQNEERVTYPTFILPRQGFPLTLLYRHGTHNNGTAYIKTYDEARKQWQDHPKPILSGAEQKPWTANAYWNNPVLGEDGTLHLSFVWRTHSLGEEKRVNNINVGYAKSYDNGLSWWTSNHQPYQLPITPANAETIWPVSPGSNLMNQCSMALDSQQRPHIVFYSNHPSTGIPTFQHLWHDGIEWRHQYLNLTSLPFNLQGGGTLQLPISRPCVLIDLQDNVHVIYRDHSQGTGFYMATLMASDYRYEGVGVQSLSRAIGFAEPVVDRERWATNQVITILEQFNEQPDHEGCLDNEQKPINIVDFKLLV
jgi:hypothetical protein